MGMNMDQYTPEFTAKAVDGQQLMQMDSDKLKVGKVFPKEGEGIDAFNNKSKLIIWENKDYSYELVVSWKLIKIIKTNKK